MTILKIKKRTNPYLQIDKTGIEDENLSWRARGMLAYLIGRPPNWEISVNQLTKASDSDGRRAVQSTLKELEQANYLIRYPYHNPETGLMDGWKSIVFETPSDCQEWKAENIDSKAHFPTDTFCACREDARRSTRPSENSTQIIIEDQQRKNLIISPSIVSQNENLEEEREEEENLTQIPNASSNQTSVEPIDPEDCLKQESLDLNPIPLNPNSTNTLVNQKDVTLTSLANKSCLGGENKGGDVTLNQTSVQRTTRVYDPALGIKPPDQQKNLQMRYNSWIPDGIWNINGKLDPNFVDWLAKDWQKAYGGDIHKKRADVLRHFKKDPANIAIAWTQYESETRHRYENAALRMNNGLEIQPDEQQQLLSRSRAVSEKMDEQVNPVAVDEKIPNYLREIEGGKEENVRECHQEVKPVINSNNVGVTSSNNSSFQAVEDQQGDGINPLDSSQPSERSERVASSTPKEDGESLRQGEEEKKEGILRTVPQSPSPLLTQSQSSTPPKDIPRNEKGSAENPEAYSMWKPEKLEVEEINPLQLRERLADLSQRFAMPKPLKERKPPKEPIEELNEWLADPVLRNAAMSKILDNDSLSVEFDEQGIPIQVIKITEDGNS